MSGIITWRGHTLTEVDGYVPIRRVCDITGQNPPTQIARVKKQHPDGWHKIKVGGRNMVGVLTKLLDEWPTEKPRAKRKTAVIYAACNLQPDRVDISLLREIRDLLKDIKKLLTPQECSICYATGPLIDGVCPACHQEVKAFREEYENHDRNNISAL